jgi:uncharacterized repeat protein (TIGR03803 family)
VFSTLVDFDGANGAMPYGTMPFNKLIQARNGNFYGVVKQGTRHRGTLFRMTPEGVFKTIYEFDDSDGSFLDLGGLVEDSDGNLYGTLEQGYLGARYHGSIFKMTPQEKVTIIHAFNGAGDGSGPTSLILGKDNKTLYGTTSFGGQYGRGTVFSITFDGGLKLKTLHNFTSGEAYEVNEIIQGSDGNLYGTARGWGETLGSVFTLKTDGSSFDILHQFNSGWLPSSGLVEGKNGQFYGTTLYGGGWGTVYSITKERTYTNLHAFAPSEGAYLYSPLVKGLDGKLYGVTISGGAYGRGGIFSISPDDNVLTTVYSFNPAVTGQTANAGFILGKDGNFYGLLTEGGKNNQGAIFKLGSQ